MRRDPYKYFRIEAPQLLEQLGQGVLELEKGASAPELVGRLLRLAHTLKGAARVVREVGIAEQAHGLEDALTRYRERREPVGREEIAALLASIDAIAARVSSLAPPPEGADSVAAPIRDSTGPLRTLQVDVSSIDALLAGSGEAGARIADLRRTLEAAEKVRHLTSLLVEQLDTRRPMARAMDASRAKARGTAEELRFTVDGLLRSLSSGVGRLEREVVQIRETAQRLRLVRAGAMFRQLERIARDAAAAAGRGIRFDARGADVGLEAGVFDAVLPALVQLVRNAIAHGIESSDERVRAGKSADGLIEVEVTRRGNRVRFMCRDDGRGIDLDAVQRAARRRGLLPPDGRSHDRAELIRLLLRGGVSTSADVTEMAGRGVGLDIVRDAAERLGGSVDVHTEPARGTVVELTVPASMALLQALIVETAGVKAAIPLSAARRAVRLRADTPVDTGIDHDGHSLPVAPLSRILGAEVRARGRHSRTAVVVSSPSGSAAASVDRIVGIQPIIVRPLPALAPVYPFTAGTWLDAQGSPQLVLDPEQLIAAIRRTPAEAPELARKPAPVLVIDDSLTTRMLEQSILESAGFEVDLAVSGEEGLEKARARRYGVFLVDVEMPGMDGFAFIERARSDPALRDIPAILVTSRDAPADRERGLRAGAEAYIVKSEFDQIELVDVIGRLLESS